MEILFKDRVDAGKRLAELLREFEGRENVVVLALPRGGVPVAAQVAKRLHLPLDIFLVRKLGVPSQRELAMGAVASGGKVLVNDPVAASVSAEEFEKTLQHERWELARREMLYRGERPEIELSGRTVILVDDGLATGMTMRVAILALRERGIRTLVVAVPVASRRAFELLSEEADQVISLATPRYFHNVGEWYEDFSQTSDDEVIALLNENRN